MTDDTIPLEAGIERRAISLTKGCYVGQEIIIRVLHRGGGRVARKLVSMQVEAPVGRGSTVLSGDREIGVVTSVAESPRFGTIALGYVHRDFAAVGQIVHVTGTAARVQALVTSRLINSSSAGGNPSD
jgi:tRNA-modifying protein YgfZ